MDLKFVWPGRTRTPELKSLQEFYLDRIRPMATCRVIESREARGLDERAAEKIKEIEAHGLEKHLNNDYIICLVDDGKEMSSVEFARFLEKCQTGPCRSLAFVVGGFLGLAEQDPGEGGLPPFAVADDVLARACQGRSCWSRSIGP